MLNRMLSHPLKVYICLAMVMTLLGCQMVGVGQPKPPIIWMTGLDITTSVPKDHFLSMRDKMFPNVVLARVRQRDEVHVMPVDSDPEKGVQVMRLTRNVGMAKEILAFFASIQTQIHQPKSYKGSTNIGGVLAYAKRISLTLQDAHKQAEARGKAHTALPRIVANIFTDGKPEGVQTKPLPGPWSAAVTVWFWGVERAYEASLRKWATTEMGLPEAQLRIVRFTDWQTVAAHDFGQHIDRTHPDMEILKRLGASYSLARR